MAYVAPHGLQSSSSFFVSSVVRCHPDYFEVVILNVVKDPWISPLLVSISPFARSRIKSVASRIDVRQPRKINFKTVSYFKSPQNDHPATRPPPRNSPQLHHDLPPRCSPKSPKYPAKTYIHHPKLSLPIEIEKKRMYDDGCRRFCSVVRVGRDRTGDLTEEMSGPKPTFYLL